jgi:DNA-binding NarL/FixJ family response regulator
VKQPPKRKPVKQGVPAASPPRVPISLVLIDDNRLLREGVMAMIHAQPGLKVLAASADVEGVLAHVHRTRPDIVLLDAGLADHDSLGLTAAVHAVVPSTRVIVMGVQPMHEAIADFVRAGASGFIMMDASFDEFVETIRVVAEGAEVLPRALTSSLFAQIVRDPPARTHARVLESVRLTRREREIVALLGEGLSNKEMAARMAIALHTVKTHVHNVLEKLDMSSRLQVAALSYAGYLPDPSGK